MIRVMIVEDEPHAQRRLQRMIERLDDFFRVEATALDMCIRDRYTSVSTLYYSISWAIVDRTWGKNMKFPRRRMQFAGKYSIM